MKPSPINPKSLHPKPSGLRGLGSWGFKGSIGLQGLEGVRVQCDYIGFRFRGVRGVRGFRISASFCYPKDPNIFAQGL